MGKFNIYRIMKEKENFLEEKFKIIGLEVINEKKVNDYLLKFYFSIKPVLVDIWWISTYKEFFGNIDYPQNQYYFGGLLISSEKLCYFVSLGKTHFYIKEFCDLDFGLNLGERIIDESNLKIKNSKFFKNRKSRTIITYHDGIEIDYDSGESLHFIKAKTINKNEWGSTACFGNSVLLNLDIRPTDLPELIGKIEKLLLSEPILQIPKFVIIKDKEIISDLNKKLADEILLNSENLNLEIDELSLSGVDFFFTEDGIYSLFLKGKQKEKYPIDKLDVENLYKFIKDKKISSQLEIENIMVDIQNENGQNHSKPIRNFIDYIDEKERNCLIDGEWYKFSQTFIDYIKKEVDKLLFDYEEKFDTFEYIIEDVFNKKRAEKDGFTNFDKQLTNLNGKFRVEKMDLYKENELFFVKIGTPQKLSYVIDQANTTVDILQNNDGKIEIKNEKIDIKSICLWIILRRKTKIIKLSDINSLIFQIKLVNWKKKVLDAGYQAKIIVNYQFEK